MNVPPNKSATSTNIHEVRQQAREQAAEVIDTYQRAAPPIQRNPVGAPAGETSGELASCLISTACSPCLTTSSAAAPCSDNSRMFVNHYLN